MPSNRAQSGTPANQFARCVLATLVLSASFAGPAVAAPGAARKGATAGGIGLRLLDVPATASTDPRARLYVVDHLAPGEVIHRRIEVSNGTSGGAHIAMYPAAASIRNGSFVGVAGRSPNELSSWTSVRPARAEIPARRRLTATVTIAVPRDAAPGERYGVVWAEVRSAPRAGRGIAQVSRVGIRLYLSVGPGGPPAAAFTIDSLTAKRAPDGRPIILATVHNSGGRAIDINGTLRLDSGPGGLSAGPFPADLGTTLAIGDTEPVTIALDKRLPAGPWDARVALHSGPLERSARATITFPDNPNNSSSPWPWRAIAILAVLLALGIMGRLVADRRYRTRRRMLADVRRASDFA